MPATSRLHYVPGPTPATRPPDARHHVAGPWEILVVGRCQSGDRAAEPDEILDLFRRGGPGALAGLSGPFALEIVHAGTGDTTLVQGPLGERPLYVRADGSGLAWGTEVAGLLPGLPRRVFHGEALREVINYRWNVGEHSLVSGVDQLPPGMAATFHPGGAVERFQVQDPAFRPDGPGTLEGWTDRLVEALKAELRVALEGSRRPVVLLSGGVDSSLLAALTHEMRPDALALTPTWEEGDDPELPRARTVAQHLGMEHRTVVLSGADIAGAAGDITRILEVPPKDYWAIALLAAFRRMAGDADLVIHGAGADMILGSRSRARLARARRLSLARRAIPSPLRRAVAALLPLDRTHLGDLRAILDEDPLLELDRMGLIEMDRRLRHGHHRIYGDGDPPASSLARFTSPRGEDYETRLRMSLYTWVRTHTQEVTRAADHAGFRTSYPFVAPPGLELAFRLPTELAYTRKGVRKPLIRAAHGRYFPAAWAGWPKLGFPTPMLLWHQKYLTPWMEDRLGPGSVAHRLLGPGLADFHLERDHQHLLALACLEDFARTFQVEMPDHV